MQQSLRLAPFLAKIMGFKNIFFHAVSVYTLDRVFDMNPASAIKRKNRKTGSN